MKQEATLLGYKVLYNRAGKLITERTSTDIKELKPYFTTEEYATLQTIVREGTAKQKQCKRNQTKQELQVK